MAIWFFVCFFIQFGLCCRKEGTGNYEKTAEEKPKKIRKKKARRDKGSESSELEYRKEKIVYDKKDMDDDDTIDYGAYDHTDYKGQGYID